MPKRGPKPRTAANSRGGKAGGGIPRGAFVPAAWLSDAARKEYRRVVGLLDSVGNLKKTDPRLVELYAINSEVLSRAHEELGRETLTVVSPSGRESANPLVAIMSGAMDQLLAIMTAMGLTPKSSRHSGPIAPGPAGKDVWAGLLKLADEPKGGA